MEEWRDVVGYEGSYQVSDAGRVRSLERFVPESGMNGQHVSARILASSSKNRQGYPVVGLCKGGKKATPRVHRLVAQAFIPNPENKAQVNHKNGVKTDNRLDNLEWNTPSENLTHAFRELGRKHGMEGLYLSDSPCAKKVVQMDLNQKDIKTHGSIADAAIAMGVSRPSISQALRSVKRNCAGFKWRYL